MIAGALIGLGVMAMLGGLIALLIWMFKGKSASPADTTSTPTATGNPVKDKLKTTLVQLEQAGMSNMAAFFKNLWAGNKDKILQDLELEAEHLAQGGPAMVLQDLETSFAKTLAAKLADTDAAQALLSQIYASLGPNHPAIVAFLQSIVPTKPTLASTPAAAAAVK